MKQKLKDRQKRMLKILQVLLRRIMELVKNMGMMSIIKKLMI